MESAPKSNEQPRFEGNPEDLRPGNTVRYHAEDGGYFVTQFGFRLATLPEGMKIRTSPFSITPGVGMPPSEGNVFHKDGKVLFRMTDTIMGLEAKFFDGDLIEVIALPEAS